MLLKFAHCTSLTEFVQSQLSSDNCTKQSGISVFESVMKHCIHRRLCVRMVLFEHINLTICDQRQFLPLRSDKGTSMSVKYTNTIVVSSQSTHAKQIHSNFSL